MDRVAIFVDAGYLYAAGSAAVFGASQRRAGVDLDLEAAIIKLKESASAKAFSAALLRIYWYDGMLHTGLSAEQRTLANMDDVKLRVGVLNPAGQQKGVDSLIVTDIIELARNHAISDAILLSGDEDTRIGVQIAQSFGVRVHLLGIEPRRGNQSQLLLQEADTTAEWSKSEIGGILTMRAGFGIVSQAGDRSAATPVDDDTASIIDTAVAEVVSDLPAVAINAIAMLTGNDQIPAEYDRILLSSCRQKLERNLEWHESAYMRNGLKEAANRLASESGGE